MIGKITLKDIDKSYYPYLPSTWVLGKRPSEEGLYETKSEAENNNNSNNQQKEEKLKECEKKYKYLD